MTNIVTHQTGTGEPHSSNHGLAAGELAIKQKATSHQTAASGKLYYGEDVSDLDSTSSTLRTFGIGTKADSGTGQTGVPIGGNLYFKEGTNMTISQGVSGDVVTLTFTAAGGSSGIALSDLSVGSEGTASGDGAIAYNNSSGVFTYTPPVHDSLSGFVSNEHIDHSGVSITAGDGLTGGGTIASTRTLNVVGGTGITANANDIQITDGGVDTTQLAADAVTGAKIADDAINSEHYTDGSIDTAHIADDQVTYAKIQNVSATDRILGRDSSGAGVIEEITPANLRTMLNVADGATAGATSLNGLSDVSFSSGVLAIDPGATLDIDSADNALKLTSSHASSGHITLDAGGDIIFDSDDETVLFKHSGTQKLEMKLGDSTTSAGEHVIFQTPTDGSANTSLIELDTVSGVEFTAGGNSASSIRLRPTAHHAAPQLFSGGNIQYYHSSSDSITVTESSNANDDVFFLPALSCHAAAAEDDNIEHTFQAPCGGKVLAVVMTSNNPLHKASTNEFVSKMQLLESDSSGSNVFGGSVDNFDTRVSGVDADGNDTGVNEITSNPVDAGTSEFSECIYNFAESGKFNLTAGKTYAFVWRLTNFPAGQSSKTHNLNITYIISWDEITASSSYGGWTGY